MLFFVVFLLFSILILRLGELQIVFGDDFKREIERTEDITVNNPVPRGKMFDRNGKIIVDNTPLNAITYTKYQQTTQKEMLESAAKLAKIINKDTSKVPVRDKKDYWILKHPKEAKAKVTKKEWALYEQKKLDDKQIYKLQIDRITEDEVNSIIGEDLETLAVYRDFNSGYALTPQIVKNKDVTPEEFAIVSENLENLPGVDTTTDWERKYVFGDTLKSILGDVTSSEAGIPKEQLEKYMARDYSRNDRVGKSYLELKYEDVLHGQKAKVKNVTDKSGKILSTEVVSEGKRGKDLVLTIDMDLQKKVEDIIEEEMWSAKQKPNTSLLDRAFVVLMDPHTGEVLSLAGKQIGKDNKGKTVMKDFAGGNITTSYNVGSAVKGATILTGYKTGAIQPGSTQLDEPLRIASSPVMSSWRTFGRINDLRALQVSSNVYMWKTVIAMAGGQYRPNQPLPLDYSAFDTMRQSFSQFGLGTRTGIDLPNEMSGFPGPERTPGLLLFLSIGQYDTYTPIQLAQYVSTIANGGNRIQPHLVKEIREPEMENNELGPIVEEIQPKVLNRLDMKQSWIKRVQEGFRMVMQVGDGTAVSYFKSADYHPAGKTGTAQAFYDGSDKSKRGTEVMNLSLVSFAPSNNPEVAMAVVVPWAYQGNSGPSINNLIGRRVLDAYFDLKKERQDTEKNATSDQQEVNNE
ncbi:penicillin-binding protein 2 [Bacillus sp. ISL-40]|uniref:peptidoglycan D,D-transpeptidase FtsI family protein n=1 Tax=unclassified Bacillus (in: firmicutes) TaxID=185979 RepID=UPI001BE60F55|nr:MULTISPECIES: penicillin-binding protein 2 [unclassified Bacillus (in: firmicutes)]MBT2701561.1 penicillin-binding protein 2 [Bacillus sp. ISL-40]MBT2725012.1 penicillin-binding protein 2 [Bacillus sp. ISL-46]MBT2740563.1 penicillin-binding protein 2 [Bacillus sp. ISL-77]